MTRVELKAELDKLYKEMSRFPFPFSEDFKKAEARFQQALVEYKRIPVINAEEHKR